MLSKDLAIVGAMLVAFTPILPYIIGTIIGTALFVYGVVTIREK